MRILILGAGALGGLVGAQLTRAGEDVTLFDVNTARARLLADDGLLISRVGEDETCVPLRVVSAVEGLAPFELVFVAVKSYETEQAVGAALPACAESTLFLSLQNGIGNAETLSRLVGAGRVLCGITYHSIQHAGPRSLRYRAGIKPIQIAPCAGERTAAVENVAAVFRRAGFDTEVVANVEHAIWQKLLHNAVVNPTSALTGLTCREMRADPDLMTFMRAVCDEIVAVMRAKGIPVPDAEDPFRPVIGSLTALGKNRPSMWQDLSRGMRTEVDALNGAIVVEAERLGLTAPHNDALTRFIHSRERQTFLHKEEVARTLGLVEHRSGPDTPATPATADLAAAPAIRRRHDAAPRDVPPLESTRKLKELVHRYYVALSAAANDRHGRVAACSALAPVEIVRALDMLPYFPEHHAILISGRGDAFRAIARAATEGFSQFASSAMRADIGALLERSSPLAALHGIAAPPRPDLALYATNTGRELSPWFEFYGAQYDIPVIGFHPEPAPHALEQSDIQPAADRLRSLAGRVETASGRTLDADRLSHVTRLSAEAASLWRRVLDTARATPAPFTFFDAILHMAPMVLLRGTQDAVDYYELLLSELDDRVAAGVGAVPNEAHRFHWDGPPIWCASHALGRIFGAHGVAIVSSTYASMFALTDLEGDDPFESMARAYTGVFDNRPESFKTSSLAEQFLEYGVDAAVFHDCRTSPDASHVRHGLGVRLEALTARPALVVEADAHDPRLFSEERLERQLADFIEQHRERFADRLVAY